MNYIYFKNIDFKQNRFISVIAKTKEDEFLVEFTFDRALPVSSTMIALALSTLCGKAYKEISFDMEISERGKQAIAKFTGAEVKASGIEAEVSILNNTSSSVLSFSGGYDSLASLALMPKDTHLVSVDFGGWFDREKQFFKKFNTIIISTNIRQTPLVKNSWSFMAVGAILTAKHLSTKYHTFGTTLSTEILNVPKKQSTLPMLEALNIQEVSYVRGLPDVGTARIVLQAFEPSLVLDSLESLAGKKDPKRFRKAYITHMIAKELGINLNIPQESLEPESPLQFGEVMYEDLSMIYLANKYPELITEAAFVNIPQDLLEQLKGMKLDFFNKFHPDPYNNFPLELRYRFYERLASYNILPYNSNDWHELSEFINILKNIY